MEITQKDVEKIGFIDRFVITSNVFSRRYEQSIINSDSLIYTTLLTVVIVFMLIIKFL